MFLRGRIIYLATATTKRAKQVCFCKADVALCQAVGRKNPTKQVRFCGGRISYILLRIAHYSKKSIFLRGRIIYLANATTKRTNKYVSAGVEFLIFSCGLRITAKQASFCGGSISSAVNYWLSGQFFCLSRRISSASAVIESTNPGNTTFLIIKSETTIRCRYGVVNY